ncbi:MAG TPA: EAL domain-containing protein [Bryobacteraceae bacterium]|nr:EAL domain-containing protein [Bryobacteraceae bacterium]
MNENNHLLLVDDEALNRDMLSRRLRQHGFEVAEAADGPSALRQIEAGRPDLVLLDIMMPGMTGMEVLKALRATHAADQLPVIMVSALADSDQVVEALSLGANDYVTKPVDFPVALARIHNQLAHSADSRALRQSEERYAMVARGANVGLWDWDLVTGQIYYCERWKGLLGYRDDEIGQKPEEWFSRLHPSDADYVNEALRARQTGQSRGPCECELRMRHRDGSYRWMRWRGAPVMDASGQPVRMAGSMTDITDSKVLDPLTGLANRFLFTERLEEEFGAFRADPASKFGVLFLDIDRFKLINDSLGRLAGDQLLLAMAERLLRSVRGSASSRSSSRDLTARIGGDEFAAILCGLTDQAQALQVAQRILEGLREPFGLNDCGVFCTVSIGIAPCGPQYHTAAEIVRDAEAAMYAAKNKGRSRCELFDKGMRTRLTERTRLEHDLRAAIHDEQLAVHYQPKVRLRDGRICGFEALARWNHPLLGPIPPTEFIPLAEEIDVIHPLDMWVLRQACAQMQQWHAAFPSDPPLAISVNLSPRQFAQRGLVEQIAGVLRETGLEPPSLHLEITEGVLMDDQPLALDILTRLKALGVRLKIDDFGTGYSSLAYLAQLPFDTLKIDRSFTEQLFGGDCNSQIVKALLDMAHSLGMDVIAEGVEQSEQITHLISLGCEFGQGFFFSKAVGAQEAERLLAANLGAPRESAAALHVRAPEPLPS